MVDEEEIDPGHSARLMVDVCPEVFWVIPRHSGRPVHATDVGDEAPMKEHPYWFPQHERKK